MGRPISRNRELLPTTTVTRPNTVWGQRTGTSRVVQSPCRTSQIPDREIRTLPDPLVTNVHEFRGAEQGNLLGPMNFARPGSLNRRSTPREREGH